MELAAFGRENDELTGADFSNVIRGVPTDGLTEKTEFFFSGDAGSTASQDKQLAASSDGAGLSRIIGDAKDAMIRNLGKFDGATAIGAKFDASTLGVIRVDG